MEFIYKVSFYDNNRCKVSHTDMYYLNPIHTRWAFNTHQITKIFYVRVSKNSNEYDSAVKNSILSFILEKISLVNLEEYFVTALRI